MKNLLLSPIVSVLVATNLLLSSTASAQLAPSMFGGIDQCQMPTSTSYENPLASVLQMMMTVQMMSQIMNPPISESEKIQMEIDDLQERIKDLKAERRSEKSFAKSADRKVSEIEERMTQFGCSGDLGKDPLICMALASRRIRAQHKVGASEDRVEEIKDEIADTKEEIKALRQAKSDAESQETNQKMMQAMMQQQMPQAGNQMTSGMAMPQLSGSGGMMGNTMGTMGMGGIGADSATSMASYGGLQGTCPTCMIQPQYGTLPSQGIMPVAQNMAPILNHINGVDPYIAQQNAQIGWPTLPYTNNNSAGGMGMGMGGSAFGLPPAGCINGQPLLPLQLAGSSFPGASISPVSSPFQTGPSMGGSFGSPGTIARPVAGGQIPFQPTTNPQPYAR